MYKARLPFFVLLSNGCSYHDALPEEDMLLEEGDSTPPSPLMSSPLMESPAQCQPAMCWQRDFRNAVVDTGDKLDSEREAAFFRGYESWLVRQRAICKFAVGPGDSSKPPKWALRLYSAFVGRPLIIVAEDDNASTTQEQTVAANIDCTCRPRVKSFYFLPGIRRSA